MHPVTVDIEDYWSLVVRDKLGQVVPPSAQVDAEVDALLDFLDELQVTATCFVVGELAERRPDLVKRIAGRNHEIASHGYEHRVMSWFTPQTFEQDLRRSIDVLQDVTGKPVRGFRAPRFSLTTAQIWAFDIMAAQNLAYDSSVRVNWPLRVGDAKRMIAAAAAVGLQEFPGGSLGIGRCAVPIGGGGGLRLLPHPVTAWAIRRLARAGFKPPLYIHPYDLNYAARIDWPARSWKERWSVWAFDSFQKTGRARVRARMRSVVSHQLV